MSGIVDEWRHVVGPDVANLLRDLAVTLRKLGMSPAQCAIGIRIINLIDKMGLDQHSIDIFLSDVYTKLQQVGVTPMYIARYVEGLVSLLDNLNLNQERAPVTSLRQIDEFLEKKKQDNRVLQEDFNLCKSKLQDTEQKLASVEKELQNLLEKKRGIEVDLAWKSELRDQLQKNGLAVDDISRLVEGARFFKDEGFNINEMLMTFSTYRGMQNAVAVHGRQLDTLKNRAEEIERANRVQEDLLQERSLKKSELDIIKGMGFGLSEMKRLHYLIDEIAKEAGLPTEQNAAVIKFFRDLEEHYDDYLNLGKKIDEGRAKLRKIAEAQEFLSITLNITPEIVKMIQILVSAGIKKADLEHLKRMIIQNRLPQTKKNSSDKNIPQMEDHPKSDYSYSETEVQGVKTVTEESTALSGSQSDQSRRDGSTKAADVTAKSDADASIFADGMNLQQMMAQIHGTDTSHKDDDDVFIPPKPLVGAVDQEANNQRVLKRIRPPPPVGRLMGVRKKKSKNTAEDLLSP